jgi:DNA replication protein DnaC
MRQFECELCEDMRFVTRNVPVDHEDFGKAFPCPVCGVNYQQKHLLKLSRLNARQAAITLDDLHEAERPQTTHMKAMARRVMAGELPWLTLIGQPGVGKSTAMFAIVNHFRQQGMKAIYLDWSELLDYIRQGYDPGEQHRSLWRVQLVQNAPVLCLDELDKARPTDWMLEHLHRFVNHRWEAAKLPSGERLVTVFAMNQEPQNAHIRSRLLDREFGYIYNQDADYRASVWA